MACRDRFIHGADDEFDYRVVDEDDWYDGLERKDQETPGSTRKIRMGHRCERAGSRRHKWKGCFKARLEFRTSQPRYWQMEEVLSESSIVSAPDLSLYLKSPRKSDLKLLRREKPTIKSQT